MACALLSTGPGCASWPPPSDAPQHRCSALLAAKAAGRALLSAAQRSLATHGIAWTSPAGRAALAASGAVIRSLLLRATAELRQLELGNHASTERVETAWASAEVNTTRLVVRGLHTMDEFRADAFDAEHFTVTSTLGSLNSSALVDVRVRTRIARLEHVGRFGVLSQLRRVSVTTRWRCALTPEALRVLALAGEALGGAEGRADRLRAQRALRPRIVRVDVRIADVDVALSPSQPSADALCQSTPFLWRLASSACAERLREAFEVQLAQKLLDAIRDSEETHVTAHTDNQ